MGGGACWVRGRRVKVKDTEYLILTKINIPYPMNHDTLYEEGKDQPVAKKIKDEVYEPTHTTPTSSTAITPFCPFFRLLLYPQFKDMVPMTHFVVTLPTFSSTHVHDLS